MVERLTTVHMQTERLTKLALSAAVGQLLGSRGAPAISLYELATHAWRIARQGNFLGRSLLMRKGYLERGAFWRMLEAMVRDGMLRPVGGSDSATLFTLPGASDIDARVLACTADPFCYVSHLSAMEYHALTDRMPEQLYVSTPAPVQWRKFADERMSKDLGDDLALFREQSLPRPTRASLDKIAGKTLSVSSSLHLGAYRTLKEEHFRVATIGRTFLDMLRDPDRCGGIYHVLEVWREHASGARRLICDEIDQHGSGIEKVRAGWILEEICGIKGDPRIDAWTAAAQRGGSRKLCAASPYSPKFSERWAISINVALGDIGAS